MSGKPALGADLVVPLLALAFAAYFLVSIRDLGWEAKANGVIIGTVLVALVLAQLVRIALAVARGRGTLSTAPLWAPRPALPMRLGMVAVTIGFIATLEWLGLTLGLLVWMAVALRVMGVRKPVRIAAIAIAVATSAYLLFILTLDSRFPHGPVERAVAALRGPGA
jgi:hypothetical protein